jgi:hypothetical protein
MNRIGIRIALSVTFVALAGLLFAQIRPGSSARWSSVISGGAGQVTAVIDLKIDPSGAMHLRSASQTPRGEVISIIDGDTAYTWRSGQSHGFRMDLRNSRPTRFANHAPRAFDYARPSYLEGAKKIGTEAVEGESCDKYERTVGDRTETVWISQAKRFPVKIVSGNTSVINRDIQIPAQVADAMFAVPKDVTFQDFGDMEGRRRDRSGTPRN